MMRVRKHRQGERREGLLKKSQTQRNRGLKTKGEEKNRLGIVSFAKSSNSVNRIDARSLDEHPGNEGGSQNNTKANVSVLNGSDDTERGTTERRAIPVAKQGERRMCCIAEKISVEANNPVTFERGQ